MSAADSLSSDRPARRLSRLVRPNTIRGRLIRILLFSLLLVLALAGVSVASEARGYLDTGDTARAVSLALSVQDVVHETQRERGLTNGLLGGAQRYAAQLAGQRAGTDHALRGLDDALARRAPGTDQVRVALARFTGLAATRDAVDARRADRAAVFAFYTDAIAGLNQLQLGLDQARDPRLRHSLQAMYALDDAIEQTGQERGFLNGVFAAGRFEPGEYIRFTEIRAAKQAAVGAFERVATPDQRALLDAVLATDNASHAIADETVAVDATRGPVEPRVDPAAWWASMTSVIDDEHATQQTLGGQVEDRARVLRGHQLITLLSSVLAAAAALGAEILLVVACLRGIVRPLAALAADADDIAANRLPAALAAWNEPGDSEPDAPAPVTTPARAGAEIASVASALDRVQTTAFELASQQALLRRNTTESLAGLGRRNQNLVRRQLGFISEFEQEELDPSALAHLFELDHLATRMRRNAESLLVLVGESTPRRWAEPIPLSDVIRAGLSEVEGYRRVVLRRVDDAWIAGSAVSELAHILAELVENGLCFSPPDLDVEIYGGKQGKRYLLAVVDHGVGMSPEQLATANARLRGEQDFIVAPTRFLGHYVVGTLSRRLGIEVELTVSPVSGVAARLLLPADMVVDAQAQTRDVRPQLALAADPEPVVEAPPPELEPVPVAPPARPEAAEVVPIERTRNGLTVRPERGSRSAAAARPAPPEPQAPLVPAAQRTPEHVGALLTSFHAGHQRGRVEREGHALSRSAVEQDRS